MAHTHAIRTIRGIQQSFLLTPTPGSSGSLIPVEPKGVVYTRRWVVDLLLDLAGYTVNRNLVDAIAVEPAAGRGAFLGVMADRLIDSCRRSGRPILDCRHALVAYELNEMSAKFARSLVLAKLVDKGVEGETAEALADSWVRTGDYLIDSMALEADFVIGNPPYIRLEEIPEETATLYRNSYPSMRGRADVYVAFFEAALRQLKDGGTCAFICADRWMRNHYGAELRDLITSFFAVDVIIEMHDAGAFHEDVDAYPAITVIRRREQGPTVVANASPEVENIPTGELLQGLLSVEGTAPASGLRAARIGTWFRGREPWPCRSPQQLALLRRLEERFPSVEAHARVGIGVATGNDKTFVTKDPDVVEPSRLLKLAMAKDISSGRLIWSGHYLINPWNSDGLVDLDQYPRLSRYFEKHRANLKARHVALKNVTSWYRTIDKVSQGLTAKNKLYIADIKNVLDPVLDNGGTYPHHNLYFIESDDWNLEVLGGLLISAIGQFFIESYGVRMRGGYLRFQAQYLRRIRVPSPDAISEASADKLAGAFRSRNRHAATQIALGIYGIEDCEMETVIGH